MKYFKLYLVTVALVSAIAVSAYLWLPDYRHLFTEEDSLIENLSAGVFLLAFCVGCRFTLSAEGVGRVLLGIVSAVALLGFLDELSFGERVFDLDMPRLFGDKIDAAHDFIQLGHNLLTLAWQRYPEATVLFLVSATAATTILLVRNKHNLVALHTLLAQHGIHFLFYFFVALLTMASVIDLDVFGHDDFSFPEELYEMYAAMALLAACFSLNNTNEPGPPGRSQSSDAQRMSAGNSNHTHPTEAAGSR